MLFREVVNYFLEKFRDNLLSVILFGSYARFGKGRDVDLIVILKDKIENKFELEKKLALELMKNFGYKYIFDIHIFDLETFLRNLEPPCFLSGVFLGYKVLYDRVNIKEKIEEKRKSLKEEYTLVDKYGIWKISPRIKY